MAILYQGDTPPTPGPIVSVPKSPYFYPKLADFEKTYTLLKQQGAKIPAQFRSAYDAILHAGATIEASLDAGANVTGEAFDDFFHMAAALQPHLPDTVPHKPEIIQATDEGQTQPDTGPNLPALIPNLPTIPWGTIALVAGGALVLWLAIEAAKQRPGAAT